MLVHFQKWNVTPKRTLFEFRVTPDALLAPGMNALIVREQGMNVSDVYEPGRHAY